MGSMTGGFGDVCRTRGNPIIILKHDDPALVPGLSGIFIA